MKADVNKKTPLIDFIYLLKEQSKFCDKLERET